MCFRQEWLKLIGGEGVTVFMKQEVCVCLFLYLLYAENQNTHSSSKVRIFVNCWGVKGAFTVVVRIGSGSGGQGVLD